LRALAGCEENEESYERGLPMSHAQSAETYARQVAAKRTPEEKLDSVARSLAELAQAIQDLDQKISRFRSE
jgi:hypothetical protein